MAEQQTRSRRNPDAEVQKQEQELAEYLQERIKPGLNSGAIPLLARSIAKEIVRREQLDGGSDDSEAVDEHDEVPVAEAEDEPTDETDADPGDEPDEDADPEAEDEPTDEIDDEAGEESGDTSESPLDEFEAEMHELQAELGEDWIVRFSVQGDDAWLIAEKEDGTQHVEAPTAEVLTEAVELLNEAGGRTG